MNNFDDDSSSSTRSEDNNDDHSNNSGVFSSSIFEQTRSDENDMFSSKFAFCLGIVCWMLLLIIGLYRSNTNNTTRTNVTTTTTTTTGVGVGQQQQYDHDEEDDDDDDDCCCYLSSHVLNGPISEVLVLVGLNSIIMGAMQLGYFEHVKYTSLIFVSFLWIRSVINMLLLTRRSASASAANTDTTNTTTTTTATTTSIDDHDHDQRIRYFRSMFPRLFFTNKFREEMVSLLDNEDDNQQTQQQQTQQQRDNSNNNSLVGGGGGGGVCKTYVARDIFFSFNNGSSNNSTRRTGFHRIIALGIAQIFLLGIFYKGILERGIPNFEMDKVYMMYWYGSLIQALYIAGKGYSYHAHTSYVMWINIFMNARKGTRTLLLASEIIPPMSTSALPPPPPTTTTQNNNNNDIEHQQERGQQQEHEQHEHEQHEHQCQELPPLTFYRRLRYNDWMIWIRFLLSLLVNHSGAVLLLFVVPVQLAWSEDLTEFVLNAVAAFFIIDIDDLVVSVEYCIVNDEYIQQHGIVISSPRNKNNHNTTTTATTTMPNKQ